MALLLCCKWTAAQCDFEGQIVEPTNNPNCGKLILSYETFELLVPTNDSVLAGFNANDKISFSFLSTPQPPQPCTAGPTYDINCIQLLQGPSQDCLAEFFFTANFDGPTPQVFFVPVNVNASLDYVWDFGDGALHNEAVVSHEFNAPGIYQVCLTVSDVDCESTHCKNVNLHPCKAAFSYQSDNGVVTFSNLSSGNYTEWEWEMGNGSALTNINPTNYDYGETNIYTVCLTVWNNNGCSDQYCNYVYSGTGDICEFATCVYPGDANLDGTANVYDLLPIGVGYGTEGPPRQLDDVTLALEWMPQFAPDWGQQTVNGHDFKHLDCNGDGEIGESDVAAIKANYSSPTDVLMVQSPGSPIFWLDFEWDTILIDDDTPEFIELEANLMAGSPNLPMQNLNGFALQLKFDDDMVVTDGITVDYNDNSFFGSSNDIIWLSKNREADGGEFDLGFTRKGDETNGFGRVATLNFIIIGDLIAREVEAEFTVELEGVVAVNGDGALLTIGTLEPATVHVVNKSTPTYEEWLNSQIRVYPNPATDKIFVEINDLQAESVKVFNVLGQVVKERPSISNQLEMDIADLEKGIYLLQVKTDKGVASKQIVVQ